MADPALLVDREGAIVFANHQAQEMFGAVDEELLGLSVDVLLPENAPHRQEISRRGFVWGARPRRMGEGPALHARRLDGTEVAVEVSLSPVSISGHDLLMACVRDVSWREALQATLRESELWHRMMVENASEVFYQVAIDQGDPVRGRVEFVSPQCAALTGYPPEEFLANAERWIGLVHPDDLPALEEATNAILAERTPGTRTYRLRSPEGGYRHLEDRVVPLLGESGAVVGYQGVARDVTDRVQAQEERRRLDERLGASEKMEVLGRLAGAVAHDFNNLLTVILGVTESMLREADQDSAVARDAEEIARAGRRAAALTRQLLAFSRKQIIAPRPLDLSAYVDTLADMLRRAATERIEVVFDTHHEVWPVFMDHTQVDRILLNLVANARDAMPDGGRVTIGTRNAVLDEAFKAANTGSVPGEYALLTVRDEGMGMDEETVRNAFEPFFTTKPAGTGTGIGLASVYGIVKQNGGFVRIQSAIGRGTTVEIYLPRHHGEPVRVADPAHVGVSQTGAETVLLVEDSPEVRAVARAALEKLGYRVLVARSSTHALALCEAHPDVIDVLLTDVVMPGMGGPDLAAAVRRLRPGIGVLLVSGFSDHLEPERLPDGAVFLGKPFDWAALSMAVRSALDGAPR